MNRQSSSIFYDNDDIYELLLYLDRQCLLSLIHMSTENWNANGEDQEPWMDQR
jgi:hypothetical protein